MLLFVLVLACSTEPAPVVETPSPPEASKASKGKGKAPRYEGPPNFVVIDIDSLRKERVGATRDGQSITPTFDAFAQRGVTFENAFSQSGWTMPALGTLMTGRFPVQLGGEAHATWVEPDAPTLAGVLGLYGYTTVASWGRTIASDFEGPSTGFGTVLRHTDGPASPYGQDAISWVRRDLQEPFLLFVHDLDLHVPDPPIPGDRLHVYADEHPDCPGSASYDEVVAALEPALGRDDARAHAVAHYDAALTFYDGAMDQLLGALRKRKLLDRTVLVLTSNHGEELWEHGVMDHGLLYDTLLRIPLIVVDPRGDARGVVVDDTVQLIDLAPTLWDFAGATLPAGVDGQSLRPLLRAAGDYDEKPVVSLNNLDNESVRQDGWKLIYTNTDPAAKVHSDNGGGRDAEAWYELYDLAADPEERTNLVDARPEKREELMETLHAFREHQKARAEGVEGTVVTEAQKQALQERGYWDFVEGSTE